MQRCDQCAFYEASSDWAGSCTIKLPPQYRTLTEETFVRGDDGCDVGHTATETGDEPKD